MNLNETQILAGVATKLDLLNENGYTSNNLYKEVSQLNEDYLQSLRKCLTWIQSNNLKDECIIVGGTAVAHFSGVPRALTPDLDMVVGNLETVKGYLERDKIPHQSVLQMDIIREGIQVPSFDTDFIRMKGKGLNEIIIQTAVPGNFAGGNFKFIHPFILAILKSKVGRNKDIDDIVKVLNNYNGDKKRDFNYYTKLVKKTGLINQQDIEDLQSFMWM